MKINKDARDVYFDNLKTILIFLVVLGHFANLNRGIPIIGAINNVIYSFHMPLFIFVSGYFSKNIRSQRAAEVENILYPFFIFQVMGYLFTRFTGWGVGTINLFVPIYQNWYLIGLFLWRLMIPYFNFFDKRYALLLVIGFVLMIGFVDDFGSFLALYRIAYFFPIFFMGYFCPDLKELMKKFSRYKYLLITISLGSIAAIFVFSYFNQTLNKDLSYAFTPAYNYDYLIDNLYLRIAGFGSSILISAGILYLIPRKKFKVTYIGENTMSIFLLHMFLVFPLRELIRDLSGIWILVISLLSSLLICFVLSTRFVNTFMNPLVRMGRLNGLLNKFVLKKRT